MDKKPIKIHNLKLHLDFFRPILIKFQNSFIMDIRL